MNEEEIKISMKANLKELNELKGTHLAEIKSLKEQLLKSRQHSATGDDLMLEFSNNVVRMAQSRENLTKYEASVLEGITEIRKRVLDVKT